MNNRMELMYLCTVLAGSIVVSFTSCAASAVQESPPANSNIGSDCIERCASLQMDHASLHLLPKGGLGTRAILQGDELHIGLVGTREQQQALIELTIKPGNPSASNESDLLLRSKEHEGGLGNAVPFSLLTGHLIMGYRDHLGAGETKDFRLKVASYDAANKQWNAHEKDHLGIIDEGHKGLWEPFFFYDNHDVLRVVYAKERASPACTTGHAKKQDIVMRSSPDEGKTWENETTVASDGTSRDGVPTVAKLHDGSFIMVFESWQGPHCESVNPHLMIRAMQSKDGVNWERRQDIYAPHSLTNAAEHVASWPYVLTLSDGRIAISFTTDEDHAPGHGKHDHNANAANNAAAHEDKSEHLFDIKLLLSQTSARFDHLQWDQSHVLTAFKYDASSQSKNHYTSLAQLKDGSLLVFSALPARYLQIPMK